ncbi:MAG: VanZ family protein [Longimicrobiales bacterium]
MSAAFRAYFPALLWAGFVLALGSLSNVSLPATDLPLDKVAHLALYGVFGALLAAGWVRMERWPGAGWLMLLGVLVAIADEAHQSGVPGRTSELADLAVDAAGLGLAFYAVARLRGSEEPERRT